MNTPSSPQMNPTPQTPKQVPKSGDATPLARPELTREENQFSITVGRTPAEVYSFWRNLTNLPRFMKDLNEIRVLTPTVSRWTVRLKSGISATWEAEIVQDIPGELIAWKSVKGSTVSTSGSVRFLNAPVELGTIVLLSLDYSIPGGKATELFTQLMGEDPRSLVQTNLKRLKALLETGEVPTTDGQSSGRESSEIH